jgi:hypothetical protein
MASGTILRKSCLNVIGVCGCHVVLTVAVDTIYASNIKTSLTLRFVTLNAISSFVSTQQWEMAHLMNFTYIVYQP